MGGYRLILSNATEKGGHYCFPRLATRGEFYGGYPLLKDSVVRNRGVFSHHK